MVLNYCENALSADAAGRVKSKGARLWDPEVVNLGRSPPQNQVSEKDNSEGVSYFYFSPGDFRANGVHPTIILSGINDAVLTAFGRSGPCYGWNASSTRCRHVCEATQETGILPFVTAAPPV